jgi:hypothetical protein
MSLEDEVLKAVGFKPTREYKNRQDYLAAIITASKELDDAWFESIESEDVVMWLNAGYLARRTKQPIPDFADAEVEEVEEVGEVEAADEMATEVEAALDELVSLTETVENTPYPEPKVKKPRKPRAKLTGKFNAYGRAEGSKTDMAIKLFEKGATMKEVIEVTGEPKYNILNELISEGHIVDKDDETKVITLRHKDAV